MIPAKMHLNFSLERSPTLHTSVPAHLANSSAHCFICSTFSCARQSKSKVSRLPLRFSPGIRMIPSDNPNAFLVCNGLSGTGMLGTRCSIRFILPYAAPASASLSITMTIPRMVGPLAAPPLTALRYSSNPDSPRHLPSAPFPQVTINPLMPRSRVSFLKKATSPSPSQRTIKSEVICSIFETRPYVLPNFKIEFNCGSIRLTGYPLNPRRGSVTLST